MSKTENLKPLSDTQQLIALNRLGIGSGNFNSGRLFSFTCELQPTPLSRRYTCRIEYHCNQLPKMRVLEPSLRPDPEGGLPHYFHDTQSLCLFDRNDWNPSMFLADTIVPWTIEWLYFYELWLATDIWHGSGTTRAIPAPRNRAKQTNDRRNVVESSPSGRHQKPSRPVALLAPAPLVS